MAQLYLRVDLESGTFGLARTAPGNGIVSKSSSANCPSNDSNLTSPSNLASPSGLTSEEDGLIAMGVILFFALVGLLVLAAWAAWVRRELRKELREGLAAGGAHPATPDTGGAEPPTRVRWPSPNLD